MAGRYNIASVLGAGGMGEVYRAEDTKLGQTVALKFLPPARVRSAVLLARLHDEVRLGRQVSHPNVCRIYDINEWGEAHFLAMEYVDGEDLARLLRRIGRLPLDKAVEIARGTASGLAAAHTKGIIHRDLKPANVMIDSDGQPRITDFGIALGIHEADFAVNAGTPAYMAPEQLDGRPASVQSDVYSLGLVMYEIFTGRPAFSGETVAEIRRAQMARVAAPSSMIKDIDPAVDKLILRCVDRDPALRPQSAREVIAALPGGDPIAAALAAGQTPLPRAIAAAGTEGSLSRSAAWSWLGAIAALTMAFLFISSQHSMLISEGMTKPPMLMEERARDLLLSLGIAPQLHRATGFNSNARYLAWIVRHDHSPSRWRRLTRGPATLTFWMRQSASQLTPLAPISAPTIDDPPLAENQEATTLVLDSQGRMVSLAAYPVSAPPRAPDWRALLAAGGLDPASLSPAAPLATPPVFADVRAAWTGHYRGDDTPIRIEAAMRAGAPVFFEVTGPWSDDANAGELPFQTHALDLFINTMLVGLAAFASVLTWRNTRARRGDRQGTLRMGLLVFALRFTAGMAGGDHRLSFDHELTLVEAALMRALLVAGLYMVLYSALEPYVRRHWPDRVIAWSRMLRGNLRDPMVGRDILIGIAAGLLHALLALMSAWLPAQITNLPPGVPHIPELAAMAGVRFGVAGLAEGAVRGMFSGLGGVVLLVALSIVLRRRALAGAGFFLVLLAAIFLAKPELSALPFFVASLGLATAVILRGGLLVLVVMETVFYWFYHYALPLMPGGWNAAVFSIPLLLLAVLALFTFRTALGGQPALKAGLLDD
ncbi:MAG TPA: serine/threonine-protein kinase [Thermoanaerobaculia bacterium]|nr:serine/threonine-protein kinase [Thermoanaerobaculia bacterium]